MTADLIEILASSQIKTVVILIAADVVLGIVAAFIKKEFVLGKLAGFMKTGILKYVLPLAIVIMIGEAVPALSIMVTVAYICVVLALIGSILDNLGRMGLPVPRVLRK